MRELKIAGRLINDDAPCYVIAELGHNHGGSIKTALAMVDMCADAGASAVKLQKRHNSTLYSMAALSRPYENENSYGPTYGEHRRALELEEFGYLAVIERAAKRGLACFATAFDEKSADFLDDLGMPAMKIASGGLTDGPLLKHVAMKPHRPVIISTGASTLRTVDEAHKVLGETAHAILHCTASYPLDPKQASLRVIATMRERYPDTVIGFSSHSPGISFSLAAYVLGARIIEHHVTLNRASKGTDHGFSLERRGLETLVEDLEKLRMALGDGRKRKYPSEIQPISKMRRSMGPDGHRIY